MNRYGLVIDLAFDKRFRCANCGDVLCEDASEEAGNYSYMHIGWETGAVVLCVPCVSDLTNKIADAAGSSPVAGQIFVCSIHNMSDQACCNLAVAYVPLIGESDDG